MQRDTHTVDNEGTEHEMFSTPGGGMRAVKTTRPDGSMTITMRGCGDAMCVKEDCYLHDGAITLNVDVDGKRTYDGTLGTYACGNGA